MTAKPMAAELVVRWMSFREHADQIMRLRRRVYCDEQGFGEDVLSSPHDEAGLHLGAFHNGEIVSAISGYLFEMTPKEAAALQLPYAPGAVAQYSKRVELREYRGMHIAKLLVSTLIRAIYEVIRPRLSFFVLKGVHRKLVSYYTDTLGFDHHWTIEDDSGGTVVMGSLSPERLRWNYLRCRKVNEEEVKATGLQPPSLVKFLHQNDRLGLIAIERLTSENLYTAPLSFQDELPRLSAQTRLLLMEQKSRISAVDFPPPPASLLDAGAGPGVYLARLSKEPKFKGYDLVGLDMSAEMVTYARLNRPDIRWIQASIYGTGEKANCYDVVHANFLFLHLLSPALALYEIHRILKPGGILYVLDVNDSTFQGPPVISELIGLHSTLYEGNRSVLNTLPAIAQEFGLSLARSFSTRVRNTAPSREPIFFEDELKFDRNTLWGLFSFIGQREELTDQFKAAQDFYFTSDCEISICIQTHVYRKE